MLIILVYKQFIKCLYLILKNSNIFITVGKQEWKNSLDSALEYYISTEEYEECSKIKNLINKL